MKRKLHKLTSLIISIFMVLETMIPTFTSCAQKEEKDTYHIAGLDTFGKDEASKLSFGLATEVNGKNFESDRKISLALSTVEETESFLLVTRKNFNLYDEVSFEDEK